MGLLNRFSRLVRANVNYIAKGAEDPEKALHQAFSDMQGDLIAMRQAVARAIATQKRIERQSQQATRNAQEWYNRAQLALQKGDEENARIALTRRQNYIQTTQTLQNQIAQHTGIVQKLKADMLTLESQLADARMKRDMYIARARAAQSSVQINAKLHSRSSHSAETVLERMENRVLNLEAQAELSQGASSDSVERQFEQLEAQNAVRAKLTQMKEQMKNQTNL